MWTHSIRPRLDTSGRQLIDVIVDRGYHPDVIVARADQPLRLVMRRNDRDVCSERTIFSSPRIERRLAPSGLTTIDLPPQPPGEVHFTCGMGRYRGRIELVGGHAPSLLGLRGRTSRLESPIGIAVILWVCSLPFVFLVSAMVLDATAALAAAGVALVLCLSACVWVFGRTEPT